LPAAGELTLINTVPSALRELVNLQLVPPSVQVINLAGEPLPTVLVDRTYALGTVRKVYDLYGPTETTTYSTWVEMRREEGFAGDIGRPVGNTRVYILDGEMEAAPVGVVGEMYIGGAGVARGYQNRAELTAERFVPDGFSKEEGMRMYRTGDLGRRRGDGRIEFLGRNDYQVKVRGFRIELGEIEARLGEHEGVGEAVVVAREDGGGAVGVGVGGEKRLVAYYTVAESKQQQSSQEQAGAEELREYLSERLPEYMVPAAYVRLERLPLTANGKVDRRALPLPEGDAYAVRGYEAPVGEMERAVAAIWAEVLKVERVGRQDNFFALGGHSMLAVTVSGLSPG
jgi:acyl-coenzyme A synthetase/AMP-(fatty) acid ligase